jgi:hypothetical protein
MQQFFSSTSRKFAKLIGKSIKYLNKYLYNKYSLNFNAIRWPQASVCNMFFFIFW